MATYQTYKADIYWKPAKGEMAPTEPMVSSYYFILGNGGKTKPIYNQKDLAEALRVIKRQGHEFVNGTEAAQKPGKDRDIILDGLPPDEFAKVTAQVRAMLAGK